MVTKEVFSAAEDAYLAWTLNGGTSRDGLRAALEAVMPMVRNATLEEAAKVARIAAIVALVREDLADEIASAIRALATQSPPPFLTTGERKE